MKLQVPRRAKGTWAINWLLMSEDLLRVITHQWKFVHNVLLFLLIKWSHYWEAGQNVKFSLWKPLFLDRIHSRLPLSPVPRQATPYTCYLSYLFLSSLSIVFSCLLQGIQSVPYVFVMKLAVDVLTTAAI
jgi:hypothetical protein